MYTMQAITGLEARIKHACRMVSAMQLSMQSVKGLPSVDVLPVAKESGLGNWSAVHGRGDG